MPAKLKTAKKLIKKNAIVLELKNVSKIFKLDGGIEIHALKNISLQIKRGEFCAITGPSGSGKSTLMHLVGCLDTPTLGKVFLDGEDVSRLSEKELARVRNQKIGFVFQFFNLLPRTTALQNASLPLLYAGVKPKEREQLAKEALSRVGLSDRLNHAPNQLSGGQQQRVAIARALINHPALILADEPTGNVDSKTSKEIMEIFNQLNQEGNTVVIVTHDPEVAQQTKRIIRLKDGEVVSGN